jgi:CRISPR-associated exonuclease Cas4
MTGSSFIAISLLALILVGLLVATRNTSPWRHPDEPSEWRHAELIYAEKLFKEPLVGMVARIDRAYRINGVIELVELKTRASGRVYASDVIELSVQRVVLQEKTGKAVSRRGWVLIEHSTTRRRTARSVMLYDTDEVLRLRDRTRQLREVANRVTLTELRGPSSPKACAKCGQRTRCTARLM